MSGRARGIVALGSVPILVALALCGAATGAAGQLPDVDARAGARVELYSFRTPEAVELDRVLLVTVPVSAVVPLTRRVALGLRGAFASAEMRRADGRDLSLSGFVDTEVRLTASLARDRVRVGVSALLPTGQDELTAEEMDVSGVIAADLLPFATSNWGSGGGVGVSVAGATPVGYGMALGLSAGYVVAREFEPLAGESFAYRPGNQLHVRAALDHSVGAAGKASLQLIYQQFGDDQTAGANLYQAGDRLQAVASYSFASGATGGGVVYAGYMRRERGHYTDVVRLTPAQDLFYGGIGLRHRLGGVVVQPSLDVRVLGTEPDFGQGYTVSAGAALEVPMGRIALMPLARARFGNLTVRDGGESGFVGLEVGLTARARGGDL